MRQSIEEEANGDQEQLKYEVKIVIDDDSPKASPQKQQDAD